jgi:hypothetical protein
VWEAAFGKGAGLGDGVLSFIGSDFSSNGVPYGGSRDSEVERKEMSG